MFEIQSPDLSTTSLVWISFIFNYIMHCMFSCYHLFIVFMCAVWLAYDNRISINPSLKAKTQKYWAKDWILMADFQCCLLQGDLLTVCESMIVLYLYDNCLTKVPTLPTNTQLSAVYLQNNCIHKMSGLTSAKHLTRL